MIRLWLWWRILIIGCFVGAIIMAFESHFVASAAYVVFGMIAYRWRNYF